MSDFLTLLIGVAAFVFIAYPLLIKNARKAALPDNNEMLQELNSQRTTTYSMLKELEFDHSSGILSDDDYRELEDRYKNKAVSILRQLDEGKAGESMGIEDEIEEQVRGMRHSKRPESLEDEIEQQVQNLRGRHEEVKESKDIKEPLGRGTFCPQCGARTGPTDRFCRHCATKLD